MIIQLNLATMSYDVWNEMLNRYVNQQGLVDYRAWRAERQTLSDWLTEVTAGDPSRLDSHEALAFWINLYNGLVIEQVLLRYPIDSIRPEIWGIPNWLGFLRFFQRPVCKIGGQPYSLNDIEHGTLRRTFREPRIHFALVCAAKGCPLLRPEAYWPERVEQQLEEDAQRFIRNPDKVRHQAPVLYCSKIFQWYGQDFAQAAGSVPAYVQRYLSINTPENQLQLRYLKYDWGLNQQENWQERQRTSSQRTSS
jgi:hypothetical protein